jgi:hypothetical protein
MPLPPHQGTRQELADNDAALLPDNPLNAITPADARAALAFYRASTWNLAEDGQSMGNNAPTPTTTALYTSVTLAQAQGLIPAADGTGPRNVQAGQLYLVSGFPGGQVVAVEGLQSGYFASEGYQLDPSNYAAHRVAVDVRNGALSAPAVATPATITWGNLGGQPSDSSSLISFLNSRGLGLNELTLPQQVQGGKWYITSSGVWEARSTFNAQAPPSSNAYWRLVVAFASGGTDLNASAAGLRLLQAPTATAQRALLTGVTIAANQYASSGGSHPGFSAEDGNGGSTAWLLQQVAYVLSQSAPVKKPAAPTNGHVDNTSKVFFFKPTLAYPAFSQYKVAGLPGVMGSVTLDGVNSFVSGDLVGIHINGPVPAGGLSVYVAGSGNIPDGYPLLSEAEFTGTAVVTPPATGTAPTVTGLNPVSGAVGASVTISGSNFTGATGVLFNGTASNFTVLNATTINVTVPAGANTGRVSVATPSGTGQSQVDFTVTTGTTNPPATAALTAALAISVATIVAGSPLTFTVTAGGGTAPYAYAVRATNNATGATTVLGTDAVGSWTPQVAGSYNIDARVTDSSNPQKTADATTRTLQVTAPSNQLPTAYAGDDIAIQAPNSQVQLIGTGSDAEGPVTFSWVQLSGPNNATGLPSASQNVVVSNLFIGNYQFQLTVTDNQGATKTDTVSVTKTAAPVAGADPSGDLQITGTGVFNKGGSVTFSISPVVASGRTAVSVAFKTSTGTVLNTDASSPFSYTWTPPNTGTYYVHAEITDSAGAVGSSLARTITVNSGATGPDPATWSWVQQGAAVRPVSLFHQTLPRQLVANSAADFANFDLAVSPGGTGSATWNSALNCMQITASGAYVVFTSKVKTRAAFSALMAVINGYTLSGNATGAQVYLGLWEPGIGLRGVGSSFSCFPGQLDNNPDQYNYLGDGAGHFNSFISHNYSISQTVREPVRVAITGDYVTAIRGTLDSPYYTDGTYCVANNFGPTWNALLDNCCWGIILSTDGTLTVNLESLEAGWFGGTGRSDNKWGQNEDATPYVGTDGNFRDVSTLKGLGLKAYDTPDFVATAIDTYNLETKVTTPTSLVFMRYPDVGRTVGNASSQFGYYPSRGGSYIWFSPAWGLVHGQTPATGTGIQNLRLDFAETMVNVFEPGVHILTPTKRNESLSMAYDASIAVLNPAGGYDMGFSVSTGVDSKNQGFPDFYGHVAHTNNLMGDSWTMTANLTDGYYEGGTAIRIDGAVRFAFGKHYEAQFRLYSVSGQYLGIMANPMPGGQSAHPAVIAFTDSQGRSGYLLRTFDTGVNSYFRTGYLYDNGSTYTWIYYLP